MHNQNEAFLHLNDALPADIARRRDMGDLAGALRLIDARLSSGVQPLLAPRLEAERLRLTRLPYDYPYTRPEAVAPWAWGLGLSRRSSTPCWTAGASTGGWWTGSCGYTGSSWSPWHLPAEVIGASVHEAGGQRGSDDVLASMERDSSPHRPHYPEGGYPGAGACRPEAGVAALPAACPQQSNIELLDCTGGVAVEYAPQRTMWWKTNGVGEFSVTYRYLFRAEYTAPMSLSLELAQPDFDLSEQPPTSSLPLPGRIGGLAD